eukprot:UN03421
MCSLSFAIRRLIPSMILSLIFSRITLGKRVSASGVMASTMVSVLARALVLRSRLLINAPSPIKLTGLYSAKLQQVVMFKNK